MKEILTSSSGTLSPNNFAPIIIPNLYRGKWSASQTGNIVTVSSPVMGFTAGISTSGIMTVSAINSGTVIENGMTIYGSGIPSYVRITGFVSGTNGGIGTYTVGWTPTTAIATGTSLTCAHQHNMADRTDQYAGLSNYGVKVYLSFPRNPYISSGFYENITITSVTSFTCIAESSMTTPFNIPVLTVQGIDVPLYPYTIRIPKNTVTVNSSIRFEALVKFGTFSADTGETYGIALGNATIQGIITGTFFNHNNIPGSPGGNSYHQYCLIKLLGDYNYICNGYNGHGSSSWSTSPQHGNSFAPFILNDGFYLIPSVIMYNSIGGVAVDIQWCINTYQLWTNISVDYVR